MKIGTTATLLLAILCSACSLADEGAVTFERHDGAYASQAIEFVVFTSATQWGNHYSRHRPSISPIPQPPVDFDDKIVVATYFGLRSGCTPAEKLELIEEITREAGELTVVVAPVPDLGDCKALVPVWDVVSIDKTDDPITFDPPTPDTDGTLTKMAPGERR